MGEVRTLVETLQLAYKSAQTIWEGTAEVRLYVNKVTGAKEIGKRIHNWGLEDALAFKEAALVQNIQHANLVPVYTVASVEGELPKRDAMVTGVIEMIMPFYERGSVFDAMVKTGERFRISEGVRLTLDFLFGLEFLHEKHRVIHRDMKSGNVFIDPAGRGRVGDLGIAVPMGPDDTAEAFPGSQLYTAPETYLTKRADRRTDIYGIGLIMHELLNGPFPWDFYDNEPGDAVPLRLDKGRRAIKDEHLVFKPHVPPRLRTIITKAIERKPEDRFPTAREMIEAIGKAPFIDWYQVGEPFTWEGTVPRAPEVTYQVSATRVRRPDRWRLSGKKKVGDWRRCVEDHDVDSLSDKSVRDFFDQMVKLATSF